MIAYVVYKFPKDYPNDFVIREWEVTSRLKPKITPLAIEKTLEKALAHLPKGLIKFESGSGDDISILEMWI
jgi:hypothetical protein